MHIMEEYNTTTAAAERSEKLCELKELQRKLRQRLQEKEKKIEDGKQAVNTLKSSAQAAVEDTERIFTELILFLEKRCSEVTELIRAQEKTELSQAEELLEQLEKEIADLKRKDDELEQLSQTEDHNFVQSFQSLCVSPGLEDSSNITVSPLLSFDGVRKSLSDMKEQVEKFCREELNKISPHVVDPQLPPQLTQQGQHKCTRKIIGSMSLGDNVQLNKAEKAWKVRKACMHGGRKKDNEAKTQKLFQHVRCILNKITTQTFQSLMKEMAELKIDTEERLKVVIDLIFEKALLEPQFSEIYANICRCLVGLKVPTLNCPGVTINFRKLFLSRCQKEFEKLPEEDEIVEQKLKELEAATEEECQRLKEELEEAKDKAHLRSLGNIKLIGEMFKLKLLTEAIMHDCIVKLLKSCDDKSLEKACTLFIITGKDLDSEKAKPRMNQYFNQMEKIVKERKTTLRTCFLLLEVLDLRRNNWVPKVRDWEWKYPICTSNFIFAIQRSGVSTPFSSSKSSYNRIPHRSSSSDSSSNWRMGNREHHEWQQDRFKFWNRQDTRQDRDKRSDLKNKFVAKTNLSLKNEERALGGNSYGPSKAMGSESIRSNDIEQEALQVPSGILTLSEKELDKKSESIIEEYLQTNNLKVAVQRVHELSNNSLKQQFVRYGMESTLKRNNVAREHMGLLLHQLVKDGILPFEQYCKGLQDILKVADDMMVDVPHIWQYLAEIIMPILHEGGIPMGLLFREMSKSLLPKGRAANLIVQILNLLCNRLGHQKTGTLWKEARLNWSNFLPDDEDVRKFVIEQKMGFTLEEESFTPSKEKITSEELSRNLNSLLQDKADNQIIHDWVKENLDEEQVASNQFVRALMTSVCQAAIIFENPCKVDIVQITQRAKLLQNYLSDEQKELQALYALQALVVQIGQPAHMLRMFFDVLYDEDVIKEKVFFKWESSKDPAEQKGKGMALKSVVAFFTWLREAEEESDN